MINQDELQAAAQEAAELQKRLENSPLRAEWEPKIKKACDEIDAAFAIFQGRVSKLSDILQQVKRLLDD